MAEKNRGHEFQESRDLTELRTFLALWIANYPVKKREAARLLCHHVIDEIDIESEGDVE